MVDRRHLDDEIARDLEPRERRYDVWDSEIFGLCLAVTPTGSKTWYVLRKIAGRTERMRIGRFPALRVKAARKAAAQINNQISLGRNPNEEKRQARAASSLGRLWELYHADARGIVGKAASSMNRDESTFRKHLKPYAGFPLPWFTKKRITDILKGITRRGARRNVRSLMGSMWRHAPDLLGVDDFPSPLVGVPLEASGKRKRFLHPDELARFWAALDACIEQAGADALRLLLLTGQRPAQIYGLRWEWVKVRDRVIVFPPSIMKSGEEHTIPLVDDVHEILKRRRAALSKAGRRSVYVFPADADGGHIKSARSTWRTVCAAAELADFQPRDLRRSWRTYAGDAQVPFEVAERLMDHQLPGIADPYLQVSPERLRRGAETVAARILQVAGHGRGADVVEFATGRGA